MAKRLSQIKKEFLIAKGASTPATPVDQAETVYYKQASGAKGNKKGAKIQYLKNLIHTNGGSPIGNYEHDLVRQAVVSLGKTPSKNINDNWRLIYLFA